MIGILAAVLGAGVAWASYTVSAGEPIVVSDDVFDLTTEVVSLTGGPAIAGLDGGNGNEGHGNNVDGVDSSNPGLGGGGPNGGTDESCPDPNNGCVDDEAGGGNGGDTPQ